MNLWLPNQIGPCLCSSPFFFSFFGPFPLATRSTNIIPKLVRLCFTLYGSDDAVDAVHRLSATSRSLFNTHHNVFKHTTYPKRMQMASLRQFYSLQCTLYVLSVALFAMDLANSVQGGVGINSLHTDDNFLSCAEPQH